jgi:SAM-dependent methyltransferase
MQKMKLSPLLERIRDEVVYVGHFAALLRLGAGRDPAYGAYLRLQLKRTLHKRDQDLGLRSRILIDRLAEIGKPNNTARGLCIGPRNSAELQYLKSKGILDVVGIDLFSESHDIFVMDMCHMTFPDDRFEAVVACHSLEHAYDVKRAAREIVRVASPSALVAIEVPIQYQPRGADLVDFGNLKNLVSIFEPHIGRILWSEEQAPHTSSNDTGDRIIRVIFRLRKKTSGSHSLDDLYYAQ